MYIIDIKIGDYMNNKKFRCVTFSLKNKLYIIIFCSFILCLVLFSNTNLASAKEGLFLWANSVVPTLFPFFVATELLNNTNFIPMLGKYLNKFMRPIFKVPGEGAYAFLMGMISGYPVGAKIVCHLREKGLCTKDEGERMLAFTNNSGPLFIIGTVGISLFGNQTIGIILLITHILACITVGVLFGFTKKNENIKWDRYNVKNRNSEEKTLGGILGDSIKNAISTILIIGGFVVIFSIIISILNNSYILDMLSKFISPVLTDFGINFEFTKPILAGIIELTNGLKLVSETAIVNYNLSIIISAFLLGFGGISILLQVSSIVAKTDLSIKKYVIGKFLQGIFASIYVFLIINFFPNINVQNVNIELITSFCLIIILCILVCFIVKIFLKKTLQTKKM